ncbi:hypothetical protein [Entomobacter blattae]|uniref:Uncharacterized protein n=1 Tax=Entomobacter blattae TaxID=2762277 RepID=A0A7H1NV08_9PROT|nr:hypothetical protein [Entomobacter blattae]QNT79618.1 hypothetical protein JGUZn3_24180 [Entomobacter blattae]
MTEKSNKIDPKELKILSDILALVLEEQSGQSLNALEAIKNRARKNKVTGGALKNLFVALAPNPPKPPPRKPRNTASTAKSTDSSPSSRAQIAKLTDSLNRMDIELRTTKARNDAMKMRLFQIENAYIQLQETTTKIYGKRSLRAPLILAIFFCGLIIGIGGMVVYHAIPSGTPSENKYYLGQFR